MLGTAEGAEDLQPDPAWPRVLAAGWDAVGTPETAGGAGGTLSDAATLTRAVARSGRNMPLATAQLLTWARTTIGTAAGSIGWLDHDPGASADVTWFDDARPLLLVDGAQAYLVDPDRANIVDHRLALTGEPVTIVRFDRSDAQPALSETEVADLRAVWVFLRAATILGAAEGSYRRTRDYTAVREQFGRSLDKIPAVRSALASVRVDIDLMDAAVDRAGQVLDRGISLTAARLALGACGDRAVTVAETCHQLCGALGTTLEFSLHRCTRLLWGTTSDDALLHDSFVELGRATLRGGEELLWDEISTNSLTPTEPENES
jgi:acyl-CoA dehydrogenase